MILANRLNPLVVHHVVGNEGIGSTDSGLWVLPDTPVTPPQISLFLIVKLCDLRSHRSVSQPLLRYQVVRFAAYLEMTLTQIIFLSLV